MIHERATEKVQRHVDDALARGAQLVHGGKALPELGSKSFFAPTILADVPADEALAVTLGEYDVAVARHEDEVFALQDLCSHASVQLSEGEVEDCTVECWLHGSQFDMRTGEPKQLPATQPIAVHTVTLDGDDVYVTLAD